MKIYLSINSTKREDVIKIEQRLRREFPQEDIHLSDNRYYNEDLMDILSSQILVACYDERGIDSRVAGEVGIFTGSLETLRALKMKHTPKLLIGIDTNPTREEIGKEALTMGAINEWGCFTEDLDGLVKVIKEFINDFPI